MIEKDIWKWTLERASFLPLRSDRKSRDDEAFPCLNVHAYEDGDVIPAKKKRKYKPCPARGSWPKVTARGHPMYRIPLWNFFNFICLSSIHDSLLLSCPDILLRDFLVRTSSSKQSRARRYRMPDKRYFPWNRLKRKGTKFPIFILFVKNWSPSRRTFSSHRCFERNIATVDAISSWLSRMHFTCTRVGRKKKSDRQRHNCVPWQ